MANPDWYSGWRHDAYHRLREKSAELTEQFRLSQWPRFDYDLVARQLVFSEDGRAKVIADIQVAGSTSVNAGNWLWAWANSHWLPNCVEDSRRAFLFGKEHSIDELVNAYVESDDVNVRGWELTAITARICDAAGAYCSPHQAGGLFLLFRDIRWAT